MRRKGLVWLAVCAGLFVGLATTGMALGQGEPLPTVYSGDVVIQDAPAPQGATLVACVQSCTVPPGWKSDPVEIQSGGEYRVLVVGAPEALLGQLTTFWIESEFGRIQATETAIFEAPVNADAITQTLNLTFDRPLPSAPPTPTPTITPTPRPTPVPPIPGDPSVSNLSRIALIAGIVAVVVGGVLLFVVRRRRAF